MSEQHPAWLIGPWLLAWLTIVVLGRLGRLGRLGSSVEPTQPGRNASIDGLRGHLALAVFLHHGVIWHAYLRTGRWEAPSSNLFNQLGQASVALFFMITAYLFVGKLLTARDKPIDWTRLYVSRVLRLTPLYLIAVLGVLAMCGALTDWTLRTSLAELARALLHWLFFTIGGAPDINGIEKTNLMTSGVTWSLPLEWMFYLLLPALALLIRRDTRWWVATASFLAAWAIWSQHKDPWMLRAFAIGGLSAWLSQKAFVMRLARDRIGSVCVAVALAAALLATHQVREWRPMLALAIAFTLIAAGNTLFGVLVSRASRSLGDLAYGVYLLHGLMLFGSVQFVIGPEQAATLTAAQHWGWLMALTPLLIALAWLAFHRVEQPCMGMTNAATQKIKARLGRLHGLARPQR